MGSWTSTSSSSLAICSASSFLKSQATVGVPPWNAFNRIQPHSVNSVTGSFSIPLRRWLCGIHLTLVGNHCPYFVHKDVVLHSSCYWPHYFSLHVPFTFKETGLTFYHLLPHAVANCFFTWIAISGYEHGSTGSKVRLHSISMTSVWGPVCGTYIQDLRQILCTERNPPNSYACDRIVWQHWVKFLKILIHLRLEANPSFHHVSSILQSFQFQTLIVFARLTSKSDISQQSQSQMQICVLWKIYRIEIWIPGFA